MTTITIRLIGGLGNQMFQYAAARALALRRGAQLRLDLSGYETYGLRRYELGAYRVDASITPADAIAAASTPLTIRRRIGRLWQKPPPQPVNHYREPHFAFDPKLAEQPLPLYMDGYWQSERYFSDVRDVVRNDLTPIEPLEPANAEIAARIDATNAVSLHVRRGDYVTDAQTSAYHGVCSLDYYRAAIGYVRSRVPNAHMFVFSDDPRWTRSNLKTDLPTTYVTANPADRGYRDMQLMSRCKHHIIANSSFSWWGAWLNPSPDKTVVAPARWFAGANSDTSDLLPSEWVRL